MLYNFCQEGKTFFAPNLKYVLAEVEVMDHDNEFDLLKEEILSKEKEIIEKYAFESDWGCLLYTSPSPRDKRQSRMPSSA